MLEGGKTACKFAETKPSVLTEGLPALVVASLSQNSSPLTILLEMGQRRTANSVLGKVETTCTAGLGKRDILQVSVYSASTAIVR